MRIAIVDTYYPDFLQSIPMPKGHRAYEAELQTVLEYRFGTHDAYSRALRGLGHEVIDIIGNHRGLQNLWAIENGMGGGNLEAVTLEQIRAFKPDCVFLQDLNYFDVATLRMLAKGYILAGQCSCRFDDEEKLKQFDVLSTSLPTHVDKFRKLGVRAEFLPLAFDPIVLERIPIPTQRTHVSFVGGYGQHWQTDELFTVLAERTPIQFWGYGFEKAPKVIRDRWRGEAWGLDMYRLMMGSLITLNRHGGISQGYANNLRLFEATGCGAVLLTEEAPNLHDYFDDGECIRYTSPAGAAKKINDHLEDPEYMLRVAARGQTRTLAKHTYSQRMPVVSEALKECLSRRTAVTA